MHESATLEDWEKYNRDSTKAKIKRELQEINNFREQSTVNEIAERTNPKQNV